MDGTSSAAAHPTMGSPFQASRPGWIIRLAGSVSQQRQARRMDPTHLSGFISFWIAQSVDINDYDDYRPAIAIWHDRAAACCRRGQSLGSAVLFC